MCSSNRPSELRWGLVERIPLNLSLVTVGVVAVTTALFLLLVAQVHETTKQKSKHKRENTCYVYHFLKKIYILAAKTKNFYNRNFKILSMETL